MKAITIALLIFTFAICVCLAASAVAAPGKTAAFQLKLADPVTPAEPPRSYRVVQTRDERDFPTGYQMSFETPVCIDEQCRIVQVTMYWNALGYYERLEYPAELPLTKKKHVPFEPQDYARLDEILKDRTSVLGVISLESLVKPPPETATVPDADPATAPPEEFDLDAWSGATPLTVKQSVVDDAAYTSWAMWRWANGEIVAKLQELTRQSCRPAYLQHLLQSDDRRDVDFALKYLLERHADDDRFAEDVFSVLEQADREHVMLSLEYLDQALNDQPQRLHARLIDACCRMQANCSPLVLDYFTAVPKLPAETLEGLTGVLDRLPYFQVHLILRLLDQRGFLSARAESNIAGLLEHENFFIARRAYEYLASHETTDATTEQVQAFRARHADRL
jgi:hypothetical protein